MERVGSSSNSLQFTASIVVFKPNLDDLKLTLQSLSEELAGLSTVTYGITVIDNSPDPVLSGWLETNFPTLSIRLIEGHGNVGFGRAHNMALPLAGELHLVLNPDVQIRPGSLASAIHFMASHGDCALLTPRAFEPGGERQYLCKRFPAMFDLFLRGFAPGFLRRVFKTRLDRYEMRDIPDDVVFWNPPIVSGCFMLFRRDALERVRGFDERYFLYFEDFDLSLRARREGDIAYVSDVTIVHGGGHASHKGAWHIYQFCKSASTFYRTWGVKWV